LRSTHISGPNQCTKVDSENAGLDISKETELFLSCDRGAYKKLKEAHTFDIATFSEELLGYGTRCQGISQFYLHTYAFTTNGMKHTYLCLPSQSWFSFTDPGRMEG